LSISKERMISCALFFANNQHPPKCPVLSVYTDTHNKNL
jgi:hypothetical protein